MVKYIRKLKKDPCKPDFENVSLDRSCDWTVSAPSLLLREHSFFRSGVVGRRNPYEHECKISQHSRYIFVKKCEPPPGSSKIYSDPPLCCVKFMLTLPFWADKKLMTLPWIPTAHPPSKKWMLPNRPNHVKMPKWVKKVWNLLNILVPSSKILKGKSPCKSA